MAVPAWLAAALDYVPRWLEFQMRHTEQPGCVIAASVAGESVLEEAFGHADVECGIAMTPRHRFRVASQSKSFTAAGLMKLREQGRLKLDDPVGLYVAGLHKELAAATIGQLLSHSAGIERDGRDASYFSDRAPFPDEAEFRKGLTAPPAVPPNTQFKYSNYGFSLLGLVIEAITAEAYRDWIKREVIAAAGLGETEPDMPIKAGTPFARGYSAKLPLGRRVVTPGDRSLKALAPAGGFVGTAADLARFFGQLDPTARRSFLSVASRREMTRPHWRDAMSSIGLEYGLGIMRGKTADLSWFGHGGTLQGFISRTAVVPQHRLTLSILTNTIEGMASAWVDGALRIISAFAQHGGPSRRVRDWAGRWWSLWSAVDLVPMGNRVVIAQPALLSPFVDASELEISGPDRARIARGSGLGSPGEAARLVRGADGTPQELWLGAFQLFPEARIAAELENRYERRYRPDFAADK